MRLIWTPRSLRNLEEIATYIAESSPRSAQALLDEIRSRASLLPSFPELGRPGRAAGTREFVVSGTRYILVYRTSSEVVSVLAVVHTSRDWPSSF